MAIGKCNTMKLLICICIILDNASLHGTFATSVSVSEIASMVSGGYFIANNVMNLTIESLSFYLATLSSTEIKVSSLFCFWFSHLNID